MSLAVKFCFENSRFVVNKKNEVLVIDASASFKNLKKSISVLEQDGVSPETSVFLALAVANTEFFNFMIKDLIENLRSQGVGVQEQLFLFEVAKFKSKLLGLNSLVHELKDSKINNEDTRLAFRNSELCLLEFTKLQAKIGSISDQKLREGLIGSIEEVQEINHRLCVPEVRSSISTEVSSQIGLK
jgi:hypothetical protein